MVSQDARAPLLSLKMIRWDGKGTPRVIKTVGHGPNGGAMRATLQNSKEG